MLVIDCATGTKIGTCIIGLDEIYKNELLDLGLSVRFPNYCYDYTNLCKIIFLIINHSFKLGY